jgi:hypothetical protein
LTVSQVKHPGPSKIPALLGGRRTRFFRIKYVILIGEYGEVGYSLAHTG